ncbi:MAG: TlpA disulfide reductase family protein [Bacteroidia bacterium]|nr:TlpA disulfide reductase family protein [Bacteroidia bacterium]
MIKYLTLLVGIIYWSSSFGQYNISVRIDGLDCEDELLLANHFGDKQYLRDTSECVNGIATFRGSESLQNGVYLVVLPKKNYFEILISKNEDQTNYFFHTDTTLSPPKMVIKGSEENELFFDFNAFAIVQGTKAGKIRTALDTVDEGKTKNKLESELKEINKSVAKRRDKIAQDYSDLFIGKLYGSMTEITPLDAKGVEEEDQRKFQYLWLREHFWDGVDLAEDGLVRSPVFHNKLKYYFDTYMPPIADTAIWLGDQLINKIEAAGSREQYKYTIHFLLGYFENAKFMCFDKALWHIAKNYYCAGKAYWADSAYVSKMCIESSKMEATLCDKVAPDLYMPDSTFRQRIRMSEIAKPVTVLVFWDINCGHCKKEMPIISNMYDSMTNENIEIYAVYTQGDWEGWKKRLAKDKFNFINVANAFGEDKFRKKYNIRTTPQIFVLDKDKNIRFKKIGAKDLPKTIEYLLEEQGVIEVDKTDTKD